MWRTETRQMLGTGFNGVNGGPTGPGAARYALLDSIEDDFLVDYELTDDELTLDDGSAERRPSPRIPLAENLKSPTKITVNQLPVLNGSSRATTAANTVVPTPAASQPATAVPSPLLVGRPDSFSSADGRPDSPLSPASESNAVHYLAMLVTFTVLVSASIAKAVLPVGSPVEQFIGLLPLPVSLLVILGVLFIVIRRDRARQEKIWTVNGRWWITILASFVSGIGASALGVGGGIFFGPLLLEISGPHPDPVRTSALSSALVLFTAGSSTIQYAVLGKLYWPQVAWYSM
jgi:hypothetical protein